MNINLGIFANILKMFAIVNIEVYTKINQKRYEKRPRAKLKCDQHF